MENSSLHISSVKAAVSMPKFLNPFPQNFYLSSQISGRRFLVIRTKFSIELHVGLIAYFRATRQTAKTAYHHCTFQFITPHFVHQFMLKQALLEEIVGPIMTKQIAEETVKA